MSLLEEELEIVSVGDLLGSKLKLPDYQRPYSWSVQATNTLFMDTFQSFNENVEEYRLGTVILHKDGENYDIVDGQQRLTTLSILLYCLDDSSISLLDEKYDNLSHSAIRRNYRVLESRVSDFRDKNEKESFQKYLLNHCKLVKIVTDSIQEAFQFFDSQNTRGKELAPHDLLKSYHLREMSKENEAQKHTKISSEEISDGRKYSLLFLCDKVEVSC